VSKRVEKGTVAQKVIRIACTGAAMMPLKEIVALQGGLKELSVENYEKLKGLIVKHGFSFALGIAVIKGKPYGVIDGHQRDRVVKQMVGKEGYALPGGKLPVYWIECKDRAEAGRKILAAVSQFGKVTDDGLYQFAHDFKIDADELKTDFDLPDFDMGEYLAEYGAEGEGGAGEGGEADARATLQERFGVPPFSVLDARQGYWQDRKRAWIALGIKSELGRGGDGTVIAERERERE